ncbi:phage integrase SAM-like domain-containing protein [Hymenobacter chitinivorans]|uniref:Integrase-like protein n=1 Tax=Hymenobacter chitinivorans DSM 11115 TaxID=1121954 RepID=A0A2M9ASY8_9BACT|nr:phage integrase SAM-like domain-containing protein [Hymenobacter chitinivorans]PJJ48814.1 integrase-like protein [Hymenobacter chitinivorans DSM 11115]
METQAFLRPATGRKGLSPLNVRYFHQKLWFPVPLKQSIKSDEWDSTLQLVKNTNPQAQQLNTLISKTKNKLMEIALQLVAIGEEPTIDLVKARFRGKPIKLSTSVIHHPSAPQIVRVATTVTSEPEKSNKPYGKDFITLLEQWPTSSLHITSSTKKQYESFVSVFKQYVKETKYPASFEGMDMEFYKHFATYILYTKNHWNGYFGACIKKLKNFLSWAETEQEVKVNPRYRSKDFKVYREEKEIVYLTPAEINSLWDCREDFSKADRKYIDLCLFGCLTGLRISDIQNAGGLRVVDGMLTGKTKKTKGTFKIPLALDKRISLLLQEYEYNLELVSDVKYNQQIKCILEGLGESFASEVTITRYKLREPFYFTYTKAALITSHSGRRTMITNLMKSGRYHEKEIMEIIGTKSASEFRKYHAVDTEHLKMKAVREAKAA